MIPLFIKEGQGGFGESWAWIGQFLQLRTQRTESGEMLASLYWIKIGKQRKYGG